MSAESPQADPMEQAAPIAATVPQPPAKPRPRTGPIVWGALILVFCAYVAAREMGQDAIDPTTWIITTIIGLGALLLVVGVVVLVRGSRER